MFFLARGLRSYPRLTPGVSGRRPQRMRPGFQAFAYDFGSAMITPRIRYSLLGMSQSQHRNKHHSHTDQIPRSSFPAVAVATPRIFLPEPAFRAR